MIIHNDKGDKEERERERERERDADKNNSQFDKGRF
jgi:hypothetical protein